MNRKMQKYGKFSLGTFALSLGFLGGIPLYASTPKAARVFSGLRPDLRVGVVRHMNDALFAQLWHNLDVNGRIELWNALEPRDRNRLIGLHVTTNDDWVQIFRNLTIVNNDSLWGLYYYIPENKRQEFLTRLDRPERMHLLRAIGANDSRILMDDFCVRGQALLFEDLNSLEEEELSELFRGVRPYMQERILRFVDCDRREDLLSFLSSEEQYSMMVTLQSQECDPFSFWCVHVWQKTADINERIRLWERCRNLDQDRLMESGVVTTEDSLQIFQSLYLEHLTDNRARSFLLVLFNCGKLDEFFCRLEEEERIRVLKSGIFLNFDDLWGKLGSRGHEILLDYLDKGGEVKFQCE